MSDFPFEFCMDYKMENFVCKPPANLAVLEKVVMERYDLNNVNIAFLDKEGLENPITDEQLYAFLLDAASKENVKEVELVVHTTSDTSKNRKKSLRKRSAMPLEGEQSSVSEPERKTISSSGGNNNKDGETNEYENGCYCDYDYYGDIRNKKMLMDEGRYTKHSKNFTDKKRIEYIKEKKAIQRGEFEDEEMYDDDIEEQKRNKNKRKLKSNSKKNEDVEMSNNSDEDESQNRKKKKKGKKK